MADEANRKLRHDLRAPLERIIGYAELLIEESGERGQPDLVPDLRKIRDSAHEVVRGVEMLLDGSVPLGSPSASGSMVPPASPSTSGSVVPPASPSTSGSMVPPASPSTSGSVGPPSLYAPDLEARPSAPELELELWGELGPPRQRDATVSLLVVDDDARVREGLAERLERKGFRVSTAAGGWAALALLEEQRVDIVLLDVAMPELGGLEVLELVRKRHSAADLPVIMATSRRDTADVVEALRLGANDYITKPVDFPVVLARLRLQLALKHANDRVRALAAELAARSRFVRSAFGRYVSDEVVDAVLASPEGLELGGEMRRVSMLMADLRGFTAVVASLDPAGVVRLLNNYLGTMADVISDHGGTVDEFVGDGILAVFGAPLLRHDDAERALACAVAMQRAMLHVNAYNLEHGLPAVEMGVAVNTGDVVVGNIGSHKRTKYGVVGAAVNLTSRIESLTVGGQVLTSDATLAAVGGIARIGMRRTVRVKGATGPLDVHEVLGIGGRFGLEVPQREPEVRALARTLAVRFALLHGKEIEPAAHEGALVALSTEGATIETDRTVGELANLHIELAEGGAEAELYAKVTAAHAGSLTVRFTSVSSLARRILAEAHARAERREIG
ncbi:MAG: response regulator [Polyangiaceae bacterium]|nr:response regulator [Polyangiaceae bacterium]